MHTTFLYYSSLSVKIMNQLPRVMKNLKKNKSMGASRLRTRILTSEETRVDERNRKRVSKRFLLMSSERFKLT